MGHDDEVKKDNGVKQDLDAALGTNLTGRKEAQLLEPVEALLSAGFWVEPRERFSAASAVESPVVSLVTKRMTKSNNRC